MHLLLETSRATKVPAEQQPVPRTHSQILHSKQGCRSRFKHRQHPTQPDPARQLWFEPETKSRKGKNTNIGGRPSKMNYNLAEQWLLSRTSPGCFPDFIAAAREQSTVVDAKTLFAKISNVGRRGPLRCNPWTNLHTRPVSPPRNDPSIKAFEDRPIDLRIRKGG